MSDRSANPRPAESGSKSGRTKLIVAGVLTAVAVVFIAQNREKVGVTLIFTTVTMSLWLALTMVLVIGLVVGLLVARSRRKNG